jgi:hypothetical protein
MAFPDLTAQVISLLSPVHIESGNCTTSYYTLFSKVFRKSTETNKFCLTALFFSDVGTRESSQAPSRSFTVYFSATVAVALLTLTIIFPDQAHFFQSYLSSIRQHLECGNSSLWSLELQLSSAAQALHLCSVERMPRSAFGVMYRGTSVASNLEVLKDLDYYRKLTAHGQGSVSTICVYGVFALPFAAVGLVFSGLSENSRHNPWRLRHPLSLGNFLFTARTMEADAMDIVIRCLSRSRIYGGRRNTQRKGTSFSQHIPRKSIL